MGDKNRTKKQLLDELAGLRQRVTILEASESEHKQIEGELGKMQ